MDPLLSRLSYLLGRLYMTSLTLETEALEDLGVDVKQQAVLTFLAEIGPVTQQQLGQRIGIDRTTIVTLVDGLEQHGYVERERSPHDRRAYQLTLTDTGRAAQKTGHKRVAKAERALLDNLTGPERDTLKRLLAKAVQERSTHL
ncbi:MarR family winged helix-turn-helix transcriptional regulator [Kibdelosporangium lantanae]|uniref:MarR family winged helix-turn-helix transcriptional regulator n=1 Tax=Kibdelosporangium lantanae TaxID=1497396 RepID=A0ABW3MHK4_9PSEU